MYQLSRIAILTALVVAPLLPGCGLWPWGQRSDRQLCRAQHFLDTLYGTTLDSVYISGTSLSTSYDVQLQRTVDFGDGTYTTESGQYPFPRIPHLYKSNGTYHAIYTGRYEGQPHCSDTVLVVIQDYVRPTLANKIRISVTGITLHFTIAIERPGLPDSMALSEQDDFALDIRPNPEHEDLDCIEWQHIYNLPPPQNCIVDIPACPELGLSGPVSLTLDGDSLLHLRLSRKIPSSSPNENVDTVYFVNVSRIPLDNTIRPTRAHAVYTRQLSRETVGDDLYLGKTVYTPDRRFDTHLFHTVHTSVYDSARITVEFYR